MTYHSDKMQIEDKDLIPMPKSEFVFDGHFYIKNEADYERCQIHKEVWDRWDFWRREHFKQWYKKLLDAGRLFLNRKNPWRPIAWN